VEICRKLNITETTFYRWKKRFTGLDVSDVRELKSLRDENRKLKQLVADLTLDKQILREALGKKNGKPTAATHGGAAGGGRLRGEPAPCVSRVARVATVSLVPLNAAR